MYCPDTTVVHIGGESAKSDAANLTASGRQIPALQIESELLYFRKHHGLRRRCARCLLLDTAGRRHAAPEAAAASGPWIRRVGFVRHALVMVRLFRAHGAGRNGPTR